MKDIFIVVNPGHAADTPGKHSPDKRLYEWQWNREVAELVRETLTRQGYKCAIAMADNHKESLTKPVNFTNVLCKEHGASNVLFVSIHVNAAGNGQWMKARGWSVYTSRGQTEADKLASCLYREATENFVGQVLRKDMSDGDPDYESDFYVLKKTRCPAVLIEHFFMDNREDLDYLVTDECKQTCAKVIVEGVKQYINGAAK